MLLFVVPLTTETIGLISLCVVLFVVLLVGFIVFLYYKLSCHKHDSSEYPPTWQIPSTDISPFRQETDENVCAKVMLFTYINNYLTIRNRL